MSLATYREIAESSRKSIRELGTLNSDGTYDNPELVRESIWYHRIIIRACEKEIGKSPYINGNESEIFEECPRCGHLIDDWQGNPNYCKDCGQKLDWGND